ncbi:MAG: hypothetical protein KC609_05550 [Myxococcales bacterium]|nr:hypothetical protein [Myxococcales bacterium]
MGKRTTWRGPMVALAILGVALLPSCGSKKDPNRCSADAQCDVGSVCVNASSSGSCVPLPAIGGACLRNASAECGPGLLCAADTCVAPGSLADGERCSHNVDCSDGLICDWSRSPYVCGRPKYAGESCGHETDCLPGLECKSSGLFGGGVCECPSCPSDSVCGATGCITPGTIAAGEVCYHNVDCQGENICLWAVSPHVCAAPAKRDADCGHDTDCEAGLLCAVYRRICRPSCHRDTDCASGELCVGSALNSVGPICITPGSIGARCLFARQCATGLGCIDFRCAAPEPVGGSCDNSEECTADAYCSETTKRCTADRGAGESCKGVLWLANSQCGEGLYCRIPCDEPDGTPGTCELRLSSDAICDGCSRDECESGLECRSNPNGEGRRCLAP